MLAYLIWFTLLGLGFAAATLACVRAWDRHIQRDELAVRCLLDARDMASQQRTAQDRQAVEALAASERRHRALTEAGAIAVWRSGPDGRVTAIEGWEALTGSEAGDVLDDRRGWLEAVHPQDRAVAEAAWFAAVRERANFDLEYRVRAPAGNWRWCRSRGVAIHDPADAGGGRVLEWIGMLEDIDSRRGAEEARMLLNHEVNHRAKNLLAVVQGVVRMSQATDPAEFASAVTERIAALARAHSLLAEADWSGAELREIAERELAPYLPRNGAPARMTLEGPPATLAAAAVQAVAVVLHELATNSAKYGALSSVSGTVALAWGLPEQELRLTWTERGGPALAGDPAHQGFGSRVIDATIVGQMAGEVERRWLPTGLVCTIRLPLARVGAAEPEPVSPPLTLRYSAAARMP